MVAVIETNWQDILHGKPLPESPARKAFREAVETVANKARTAIPELNGRVERAVQIILNGDLSIAPDGQGTIASQSNGNSVYAVGKGEFCNCKDHPKAVKHLCKHVLAYHIFTRATALAKQRLAELDSASHDTTTPAPDQPATEALVPVTTPEPVVTPALPEAPASVNCHIMLAGRQVQVTLRDTDETRLLARLAALLQQYPIAQPPTPPDQGTAQPVPDDNPYCHIHKVPLKQFSKHGRTWYSHKTSDGSWCRGK
jgi:hypothetical protein